MESSIRGYRAGANAACHEDASRRPALRITRPPPHHRSRGVAFRSAFEHLFLPRSRGERYRSVYRYYDSDENVISIRRDPRDAEKASDLRRRVCNSYTLYSVQHQFVSKRTHQRWKNTKAITKPLPEPHPFRAELEVQRGETSGRKRGRGEMNE